MFLDEIVLNGRNFRDGLLRNEELDYSKYNEEYIFVVLNIIYIFMMNDLLLIIEILYIKFWKILILEFIVMFDMIEKIV